MINFSKEHTFILEKSYAKIWSYSILAINADILHCPYFNN